MTRKYRVGPGPLRRGGPPGVAPRAATLLPGNRRTGHRPPIWPPPARARSSRRSGTTHVVAEEPGAPADPRRRPPPRPRGDQPAGVHRAARARPQGAPARQDRRDGGPLDADHAARPADDRHAGGRADQPARGRTAASSASRSTRSAATRQGIVHVIGPELGLTQPGMTIVCGDSHTATHGAFGALAFGIGTSEVEMVLATQTLLQRKPKTLRGPGRRAGCAPGVSAKDIILALIARIGIGGGTGHVFEYRGEAIRALSMEERMTICNMSIEGGARAGLIAPDDTTFEYLHGRRHAPQGAAWDAAVAALARRCRPTTAPRSTSDRRSTPARSSRWSPTAPTRAWACRSRAACPAPRTPATTQTRRGLERASSTWACTPGEPLAGHPVDVVFIGSCTNSRISDLRAGRERPQGPQGRRRRARDGRAGLAAGEGARPRPRASTRSSAAAGAEWREAGCSMCIAMNGDQLSPGQYAVSTRNRNFEGRQGKGGRTFLASPLTAAASAITGGSPTRGRCRASRRSSPSAGGTEMAERVPRRSRRRSSRCRRRTSTPTRSSRRATSR